MAGEADRLLDDLLRDRLLLAVLDEEWNLIGDLCRLVDLLRLLRERLPLLSEWCLRLLSGEDESHLRSTIPSLL